MRFLHIADLHLGRSLGDVSLLDDQKQVLWKILQLCLDHSVEAVLIAGDIYQKAAPQAEAMALFDGFVSALTSRGILVFAVSGNHDSALRVSYFSGLLQKSGVYLTNPFDGKLQSVEVQDSYGPILIHLLPYIRLSSVRLRYPDLKIDSCTDAVRTLIEASNVDFSGRSILLAHQYITGGEMAGSEERIIGTLDNVDAGVLKDFDYVALGHLHRPQKIGCETVRYAGSPLKYSFAEADDRKTAVLLDLKEKGKAHITLLPIPSIRDVRQLKGNYQNLMEQPYSEDYLWITVHDELVPPYAR